jgi:tetratricopeptide (TPR) repeat protein
MQTDFRKASELKNLLMHTEGDQTHITNDVETVRKLLKRESVLKEVQERLAKLEESHKKLGENHEKLGESHKKLGESHEKLGESHEKLGESYEKLEESHEKLGENHEKLGESYEKLEESHEKLGESHEKLGESHKKLRESHKKLGESHEKLTKRARDHEEQARLRALIEMDLRCNNIRKSLLAFPDGRFKSKNGGQMIDPETREERNINTHALLLSPCLHVCSMEAAESRHSNLFEVYFGISAEEAKSWSIHEFEDINLHQLFQKHSLLVTNGVARDSLKPFKAFKRAMRELVRLADQKMDISNARAEAVGCAREAIATAGADEDIARRLKLFTYATREKWSKKQPNPKENPYNWPAIIEYWQDEGHWGHVANHTNVTET